MITLTAEIHCDTCKTVIACGEPCGHWRDAVDSAVRVAKAIGAIVGLAARCADCESTTSQPRNLVYCIDDGHIYDLDTGKDLTPRTTT